MRSANSQRHVHVVLDHDDRDVARNGEQQLLHVSPLVDRQAGERLVEQQHLRLLRQRHGDLDAAGARHRMSAHSGGSAMWPRPTRSSASWACSTKSALPVEIDQRIPARRRKAEQRQRDVVDDGVARKQRDDLIGARHAEMRAPPARHTA